MGRSNQIVCIWEKSIYHLLCRRNVESKNFSAVSFIQFGTIKNTADRSFAERLPQPIKCLRCDCFPGRLLFHRNLQTFRLRKSRSLFGFLCVKRCFPEKRYSLAKNIAGNRFVFAETIPKNYPSQQSHSFRFLYFSANFCHKPSMKHFPVDKSQFRWYVL